MKKEKMTFLFPHLVNRTRKTKTKKEKKKKSWSIPLKIQHFLQPYLICQHPNLSNLNFLHLPPPVLPKNKNQNKAFLL